LLFFQRGYCSLSPFHREVLEKEKILVKSREQIKTPKRTNDATPQHIVRFVLKRPSNEQHPCLAVQFLVKGLLPTLLSSAQTKKPVQARDDKRQSTTETTS
jgi:hypothetical protein